MTPYMNSELAHDDCLACVRINYSLGKGRG
jgi:hypothetical protein